MWWNSSWAISNPKRWCCESTTLNMPANLENSAVATGLEKVSFHSNPKKSNAKECSNYCTIALISHASKVMLKILQARLQQYVNWELPNVQAGFRKGRGTKDQIVNICWIIKKQENSRKTSTSAEYISLWLCIWTEGQGGIHEQVYMISKGIKMTILAKQSTRFLSLDFKFYEFF